MRVIETQSATPINPRKPQWVAGAVFATLGLILAGVSVVAAPAPSERSTAVPVNVPFEPVMMVFALIFLAIGYATVCAKFRFSVDFATGKWTLIQGVPPFCRPRTGDKDTMPTLRMSRAFRTIGGRRSTPLEVWTGVLVFHAGNLPSVEVTTLDLVCSVIDETEAAAAYSDIANGLGIPFVSFNTTQDSTETTATTGTVTVQAPPLPPRYADSNLIVTPVGEGGIKIQKAVCTQAVWKVRAVKLAVSAAGIAIFVVPMWPRHNPGAMPPVHQSRIETVLPFLFLLPFVCFIAIVAVAMYLIRRYVPVPATTPVASLVFDEQGVKLFGADGVAIDSYKTSELTDVWVDSSRKDRQTWGASFFLFGYSVTPTGTYLQLLGLLLPIGRVTCGQNLMGFGPFRTDVNLGGADLSTADFEWYAEAVRRLLQQGRDKVLCQQLLAAPRSERTPVQRRLQVRDKVSIAAICLLVVTLVNSSTLNLAIRKEWAGADGTRFYFWTSGWKTASYSQTSDRVKSSRETSYSPIGQAYQKSGTPANEALPVSSGSWSIGPAQFGNDPFGDNVLFGYAPDSRGITPEQALHNQLIAARAREASLLAKPTNVDLLVVGRSFQYAREYNHAMEFYNKVLDRAKTANNPIMQVEAYRDIADCFRAEGDMASASSTIQLANSVKGLPTPQNSRLRRGASRLPYGSYNIGR